MKRYLTAIFVGLSIIAIIVGFQLDVRWNGVFSWGLAFILLLFAAYFTKYIANDSTKKEKPNK